MQLENEAPSWSVSLLNMSKYERVNNVNGDVRVEE